MSGDLKCTVLLKRLPGGEDLPAPERATAGSAGVDLRACVDAAVTLRPGERAAVPTGVAIALPVGFEAQVRPRSGLALERGVTLANTPGTIDADYRGEIRVILINLGSEPVTVERGDRIAQLVVHRLPEVAIELVDELPRSDRGAGGFGHSGIR